MQHTTWHSPSVHCPSLHAVSWTIDHTSSITCCYLSGCFANLQHLWRRTGTTVGYRTCNCKVAVRPRWCVAAYNVGQVVRTVVSLDNRNTTAWTAYLRFYAAVHHRGWTATLRLQVRCPTVVPARRQRSVLQICKTPTPSPIIPRAAEKERQSEWMSEQRDR